MSATASDRKFPDSRFIVRNKERRVYVSQKRTYNMKLSAEFSKIREYLATQPVSKAWVFGSFARGEASLDSDIDILVDFDEGVGLFKYSSILTELEDLLQRSVDLVSSNSLFPWIRESVNNDKILIYER